MMQITPQQLEAIRTVCREYCVARLALFGSATRSNFDPERSDVDILVEFAPEADLGPRLTHFWNLHRRLEAILGRKVDLVMAHSLCDPYLIRAINRERQQVYAV